MRSVDDVERFLQGSEINYSDLGNGMYLVDVHTTLSHSLVIKVEPPLVVFRLKAGEVPVKGSAGREDFLESLLRLNGTALLHSSFSVGRRRGVPHGGAARSRTSTTTSCRRSIDDMAMAVSQHLPGSPPPPPRTDRRYSENNRMGLFGRLASLIKSNLNDLISKSEDPEKMLNQVILEMNQQLVEAKKQVALSIADEKRLAKQFETERATAEEWERKAMMAVRAGDDDLAKEALLRQKEHETLSPSSSASGRSRRSPSRSSRRPAGLEQQDRGGQAQEERPRRAQEAGGGAEGHPRHDVEPLQRQSAFDTFQRMEEKIVQMEAEADAQGEVAEQYSGDVLAQKFKDLETTRGADVALDELKRKMGLAASAAPVAQQVRVDATPAQATAPAETAEATEAEELEAVLAAAKARRAGG
jgi:phage shock protein A